MKTNESTMKPLSEYFRSSSAYWGERSDWLVAATTNRDADCLTRSNWRSFIKLLGGDGSQLGAKGSADINENVAIKEATHWACGWVQYLLIDPKADGLVAIAEDACDKLEDYPVINEDDWSTLEYDEYYEFFTRDAQSEFARELGRKFELCDACRDALENAPVDLLITWFESWIPSGEYQNDGYPNFDYGFRAVDRDEMARLLRDIRSKARA